MSTDYESFEVWARDTKPHYRHSIEEWTWLAWQEGMRRATGVQATEVAPREGSPDDMLTVAHVTTDGGGILTMLAASLGDLIDIVGDEPETYSVSIATMKRADFDAMGEFDGF